jgi:hypothetical protein
MSKLLHVLNVRPRINSGMAVSPGGWPSVDVTILTEAAPAFLPLESWAPLAFAPPIFSFPTEQWRRRQTSSEVAGGTHQKISQHVTSNLVIHKPVVKPCV